MTRAPQAISLRRSRSCGCGSSRGGQGPHAAILPLHFRIERIVILEIALLGLPLEVLARLEPLPIGTGSVAPTPVVGTVRSTGQHGDPSLCLVLRPPVLLGGSGRLPFWIQSTRPRGGALSRMCKRWVIFSCPALSIRLPRGGRRGLSFGHSFGRKEHIFKGKNMPNTKKSQGYIPCAPMDTANVTRAEEK